MDDRKVLFVYDCDGTLIGPSALVWALAKKEGKTKDSILAFKKKHPQKAMIPGMEELVRWTANDGINVLLSGGDPLNEGCPELNKLIEEGLFTNWKCEGKDVPLGREPIGYPKESQTVANELLKYFNPKLVIVIGDMEYPLAVRMKAVGYLHRGASFEDAEVIREELAKEVPDMVLPNILCAQTGGPMLQEIIRRKKITEGPQQAMAAKLNELKSQRN